MCTLSVISIRNGDGERRGFRVVASRDEQRDRPQAIGPRWRALKPSGPRNPQLGSLPPATRAIWPTDTKGGGTWIAAADNGMVLCLMNLNPTPPVLLPEGLRSRGLIVPCLVECPGADAAVSALEKMDLSLFAPFRVVVIEPHLAGARTIEAKWDRDRLTVEPERTSPACFVSSGLGDARVLGRLSLFDSMITDGEESAVTQDRFHAHSWPDRPELSVLMSRADARTVSITAVEVFPGLRLPSVSMAYTPILAEPAFGTQLPGQATQVQLGRSVAALGTGV